MADILDLVGDFNKQCQEAARARRVGKMNHNANGRAWPIYSNAAGVAESQVAEAIEHSRQIGEYTEFTPDGDAVFTDAGHRKRYCEKIGLYDRNGGYGCPQNKDRHE